MFCYHLRQQFIHWIAISVLIQLGPRELLIPRQGCQLIAGYSSFPPSTPILAFHQALPTIWQYLFILLGVERHCKSNVFCLRVQHRYPDLLTQSLVHWLSQQFVEMKLFLRTTSNFVISLACSETTGFRKSFFFRKYITIFSRISQLPPLYEFANQQLCFLVSASFPLMNQGRPNLYERFSIAKPSPQVFSLTKAE